VRKRRFIKNVLAFVAVAVAFWLLFGSGKTDFIGILTEIASSLNGMGLLKGSEPVVWIRTVSLCVMAASITPVLVYLVRPKKHSTPSVSLPKSNFEELSLKQPLQKPQVAPWRASGTQIGAEASLHPETVTPKRERKKLIRRIT
jgi:hypothetical protein